MIEIELVDFAEYLADEARKVITPYYRQNLIVESKADSSPVTEADKKTEEVVRKLVQNNFPHHGIFGEEFGSENQTAEYVWVVDPIDGTKSFISGRPIFGTLISLTKNGVPVIGVIDQPILQERWVGVNGATKMNNKPIKTRSCEVLSDAIFATTSPYLFDGQGVEKVKNISDKAKAVIYGGDCYSYGQLAMGGIDVVIESGLKPYDFCALVPVIEGAGGVVTDWEGKPLNINSSGKILACGDKFLHQKLVDLLS